MTSDATAADQTWSLAEEAGPTPCVFVVGAGLVGTALAGRMTRAGVPVAGIHGRARDLSSAATGGAGVLASSGDYPEILSDADVVIISARDSRIAEVAKRLVDEKRLRPRQVLLHTAGNRPASEALAPAQGQVAGLGTLHPLVAIAAGPGTLDSLTGAAFGIEGDEIARRAAARLARMIDGRPLAVRPEAMSLYHAGAVVASNYVVALASLARSIFVAAGVPEPDALPALLPLLTSAVRNVVEVGLPAALTGPVVRGDVPSVERHLAALKQSAPELLDLYQRLGQETLRLARQQRSPEELDPVAVERLASLFGGSGAQPVAKTGAGAVAKLAR